MSVMSNDMDSKERGYVETREDVSSLEVEDAIANYQSRTERRVVLKQDLVILPLLFLSLFSAYLDRGQIGNARVLGMQKDIGLTSQQFYNVIMIFYVGYMIIELPAGLALRYIHPRFVFASALIVFGICSTCLSVAQNYATVMVLRVLIGLGEAFINNAWLFISVWYSPRELALRTAAIYASTPIAGAVSGVLAYAIGRDLENASGMHSWQWLFIVEGVCTIGFGLLVIFLLPGMPDVVAQQSSWLFRSEDERQTISRRFRDSQNSKDAKFQLHQVWMAAKDPKLYLGSVMVGAQGIGIGAFSVFLPTFVRGFGFSVLDTQLYSMIPYAFGLASLVGFALTSDRLISKSYITIVCLCITSIGFILLLCVTNRVALVAGACFVAVGAYPGLVSSVAFNLPIHGGFTKRATAVWVSQVFIQGFSIIASRVYRSPPRFLLGHGFALGIYVIAIVCTVLLRLILVRANAAKEQRKVDSERRGELDPDAAKSFEELGDFHPKYFYSL